MIDKIPVKNIFAAVSNKSILDPLLEVLDPRSVRFWGTEGTVKYLKSKGFSATSVVAGFDFDGRVKSLDRAIFARILAERTNKKHLAELRHVILEGAQRPIGSKQEILLVRSRMSENTPGVGPDSDSSELIVEDPGVRDWEPFDLVIVDLYKPDPKNFPKTMDIGGQALIRAAVKNYKSVALAFDARSLESLVGELVSNNRSTDLTFRKKQAGKAAKFIAERCQLEAALEL